VKNRLLFALAIFPYALISASLIPLLGGNYEPIIEEQVQASSAIIKSSQIIP